MTSAEVAARLRGGKNPFWPFVLRLKSGRSVEIRGRGSWAFAGGVQFIYVGERGRFQSIDVDDIAAIQDYKDEAAWAAVDEGLNTESRSLSERLV